MLRLFNVSSNLVARTLFVQLPFFVDSIENETMIAYSALPERLYAIQDGKIIYEGGPGPFAYNITDLEQFLEKYLS